MLARQRYAVSSQIDQWAGERSTECCWHCRCGHLLRPSAAKTCRALGGSSIGDVCCKSALEPRSAAMHPGHSVHQLQPLFCDHDDASITSGLYFREELVCHLEAGYEPIADNTALAALQSGISRRCDISVICHAHRQQQHRREVETRSGGRWYRIALLINLRAADSLVSSVCLDTTRWQSRLSG